MTSKRPGADKVAPKIAGRVADYFKREKVDGLMDNAAAVKELKSVGFSDPRSCQGNRACVDKLAVLIGAHAVVVSVDVGKIGKTLAIHLEAVAADSPRSLATLDVSSSLDDWSDALSVPMVVFVRDVKAGLPLKKTDKPVVQEPPPTPPPAVVAQSDTPKKVELVPEPKVDETPTIVTTEPGKPPKVAAWVFAGGAVVAAGASIGVGIMAGDAKKRFDASLVTLPDGTTGTTMTQAQAQQVAGQANAGVPISIASGVVSAALTGLATYFFLKD
jgi:hypothetical protein